MSFICVNNNWLSVFVEKQSTLRPWSRLQALMRSVWLSLVSIVVHICWKIKCLRTHKILTLTRKHMFWCLPGICPIAALLRRLNLFVSHFYNSCWLTGLTLTLVNFKNCKPSIMLSIFRTRDIIGHMTIWLATQRFPYVVDFNHLSVL